MSTTLSSGGVLSRRSALLGGAGLALGLAVPTLSGIGRASAALSGTGNFPVLRRGSTGTAVSVLQAVLGVGVDGDFGPATQTAVVNAQRARGLVADGIVGAATWGALLSQVQRGSTGPAVRGVQARFGLTRDGDFGPATQNAVVNFQRSKGLTADGIVGPATWGAILGASGGSSGGNPRGLYTNGRMPDSALASVGFGVWRMSTYCINDFRNLNSAFRSAFGVNLPISSGSSSAYRTYDEQVYFWNLYQSGQGNLAAYPGTSNHGWGLACDISLGGYGSSRYNWMNAHAPSYGFNDDVSGESWHWAYQR